MVGEGASDLHCKPGTAPVLRVGGVLRRLDRDPLTPEDVARLAQQMLDADQQEELIRTGSTVGAHSESGVGRFRFAAYRQRGSVSLVLHAVPDELRLRILAAQPVCVAYAPSAYSMEERARAVGA